MPFPYYETGVNPMIGAGLEYVGNSQRNVEILAKVQSSQPVEESLTSRGLIRRNPEEEEDTSKHPQKHQSIKNG